MQFPSLLGHSQELLTIIRKSAKPADHLIDAFFRSRKYLGSHDRRFIAEAVYGTIRHLRRCEALATASVGAFPDDVSTEDSSLILLAVYLVKFDHRKDVAPNVLGPKLRSARLKESLLRFLSGLAASDVGSAESTALRHSFPDWMVDRFVQTYGTAETEALCSGLNEPAPLTIRVNTLKTTVKDCQEALAKQGIETKPTRLSPFGLSLSKRVNIFQFDAFRAGLFEVHDEGSQLLPLLIDPKPTWKVLDACAGAGGKTLQLAALMNNRGEIFAADPHSVRLEALRKRTRRAGVSNVRVIETSVFEAKLADFAGFFDAVLIDAPCSGLGTIRRNPGLKWSVTEQSVNELSEKQLGILSANAGVVKQGGKMFYATCTMLREENEDVIGTFLGSRSDFRLALMKPAAEKWNLSHCVEGDFLKLLPHRHGTDGFFCAILEKN